MAEWIVPVAYAIIFGGLLVAYLVISGRHRRRWRDRSRRADEERAMLDWWGAGTKPCPTCAGSGRVPKEAR